MFPKTNWKVNLRHRSGFPRTKWKQVSSLERERRIKIVTARKPYAFTYIHTPSRISHPQTNKMIDILRFVRGFQYQSNLAINCFSLNASTVANRWFDSRIVLVFRSYSNLIRISKRGVNVCDGKSKFGRWDWWYLYYILKLFLNLVCSGKLEIIQIFLMFY